jgi:hypothetical protein
VTGPPGWLLAATAGLRRPARRGWAWARLGWCAVSVAGVGWVWAVRDPRPWVAVALAAGVAVAQAPMVLLAVERLTRKEEDTPTGTPP